MASNNMKFDVHYMLLHAYVATARCSLLNWAVYRARFWRAEISLDTLSPGPLPFQELGSLNNILPWVKVIRVMESMAQRRTLDFSDFLLCYWRHHEHSSNPPS